MRLSRRQFGGGAWRAATALSATVLVAAVSSGCHDDPADVPSRWLHDVEADLPPTLSEVGVFASVATRAAADDVLGFEPAHPLFSNGLAKERHLHVPPGTAIDPAELGWEFPVGTVLAKTFVDVEASRAVETRLLFRRADGWDYALYAWRDDGSDAEHLPGNWPEQDVALASGVTHTLPARLDCRTCHETTEATLGTPVLGLSGLQLTDDLAARLPFAAPPEGVELGGRTAAEAEAFGYFVGNCISCHTGGRGTNASFSLLPGDVIANTVNQETESETGEGIRVVPGNIAESVMYVSVVLAREPDYEGAFKAMPPIGLAFTDPAVEAILRAWIEEL